MIYYFSGTGNSKWIAEEIAKGLDDKAVDMTKCDSEGECGDDCSISSGERIGLVFPVYAWGPPEIVSDFAGRLKADGKYTFAVCTCSSEAGNTIKILSKFFPVKGAWSVAMPANYVPSPLDDEETIRKKITEAREKIPEICSAVKEKRTVTDVCRGSGTFFKSSFGFGGFNKFARGTGVFSVTDDCTGCGMCADVCHMDIIRMDGDRPEWKYAKCSQCMACINVCPVTAILYGGKKKEQDLGRYMFERDGAKYL